MVTGWHVPIIEHKQVKEHIHPKPSGGFFISSGTLIIFPSLEEERPDKIQLAQRIFIKFRRR